MLANKPNVRCEIEVQNGFSAGSLAGSTFGTSWRFTRLKVCDDIALA